MPQKIVNAGPFVVGLGFARSGTWSFTERNGDERIVLVGAHVVRRHEHWAASAILGPMSLIVGYAGRRQRDYYDAPESQRNAAQRGREE